MKKFIRHIAFFFIPLLMFFVFLEILSNKMKDKILSVTSLRKTLGNIECEYQWIEKITHPHKVLLLGSSTVKYGLSCSILNKLSGDSLKFINLGANARDPIVTYFLIRNIDLKGVDAMYMGLDPWIYSKNYYIHRNKIMYSDFSTAEAATYFKKQDRQIFQTRWKNLASYFMGSSSLGNCISADQQIPGDFGSMKMEQQPLNFNDPVQDKFKVNIFGWSTLQFIYLLKIEKYCRQNGIAFFVFIPPKRSDFCNAYKSYSLPVHAEFVKHLEDIHFQSPIFGTFDQLRNLGDTLLFSDAYHLNETGQKIYSKLFFEMISSKNRTIFGSAYKWFID